MILKKSKLEFFNAEGLSYQLRSFFLEDGTLALVLVSPSYFRLWTGAEVLYSLPEFETFDSLVVCEDSLHPWVERSRRCIELGLQDLVLLNLRQSVDDPFERPESQKFHI